MCWCATESANYLVCWRQKKTTWLPFGTRFFGLLTDLGLFSFFSIRESVVFWLPGSIVASTLGLPSGESGSRGHRKIYPALPRWIFVHSRRGETTTERSRTAGESSELRPYNVNTTGKRLNVNLWTVIYLWRTKTPFFWWGRGIL